MIVRCVEISHQRHVIPIRHLDDPDTVTTGRTHGFTKSLILLTAPLVVSIGIAVLPGGTVVARVLATLSKRQPTSLSSAKGDSSVSRYLAVERSHSAILL